MKADRFQVFKRLTLFGYRWYWHLRARNGEIIAHGEGYRNKVDAMRAVDLVCSTDASTPVDVLP